MVRKINDALKEARKATQFKPGNPGGGRPKGALSYKDRFEKYLQLEHQVKMPDGTVTDKAILDGIILSALAKARQGDVRAMEFVFNRSFGKEPDKMELTGKDGQPLEIEHSQRLQTAWAEITDAFDSKPNRIDKRPEPE